MACSGEASPVCSSRGNEGFGIAQHLGLGLIGALVGGLLFRLFGVFPVNWLFDGSHSGGERAAAMYSIPQSAKLNGVNPEAYLTDTLCKIAARHTINRISELMPGPIRHRPRDRRLITAETGRLPAFQKNSV